MYIYIYIYTKQIIGKCNTNAFRLKMKHKCNINATYVHFTKIPSRRAECIFVAFPNYLHFTFLLYFNYLGKTGQANRLDTSTHESQ